MKIVKNNEGIEFPLPKPTMNLNGTKRKLKNPRPKKIDSKFAVHIPHMKIKGFRVELSNKDSDFKNNDFRWECILHQGTGKNAFKCQVIQKVPEQLLKRFKQFCKFKKDVLKVFKKRIKASNLQQEYCINEGIGPMAYLNSMKELINKHFPEEMYIDESIDNSKRFIDIDRDSIPLRIVAGLYICNHFVKNIKNG